MGSTGAAAISDALKSAAGGAGQAVVIRGATGLGVVGSTSSDRVAYAAS